MEIKNLGNGKLGIDVPFSPTFIERIKKAGGRWDGQSRVWVVDERTIEIVREIMRAVYGCDDRPQELVNVRIIIGEDSINMKLGPVAIFGRNIASARGRDSGAKVGEGVVFKKGGCDSGGSRNNWCTVVLKNSEIVIYDVPRGAVDEKIGWQDWYGTYEIVENDVGDQRIALEKERDVLLKRLAEIESLLNS